jgi:hypothetical protein
MRGIRSTHLILLDIIALVTFVEEYKFKKFIMEFLHLPCKINIDITKFTPHLNMLFGSRNMLRDGPPS